MTHAGCSHGMQRVLSLDAVVPVAQVRQAAPGPPADIRFVPQAAHLPLVNPWPAGHPGTQAPAPPAAMLGTVLTRHAAHTPMPPALASPGAQIAHVKLVMRPWAAGQVRRQRLPAAWTVMPARRHAGFVQAALLDRQTNWSAAACGGRADGAPSRQQAAVGDSRQPQHTHRAKRAALSAGRHIVVGEHGA